MTPELIKFLKDDPRHFREISPERFEQFAADRLDRMGYSVTLAGETFRKDGGVDLIASRLDPVLGEFLIAGQVKHHRGDRKTASDAVRGSLDLRAGSFPSVFS